MYFLIKYICKYPPLISTKRNQRLTNQWYFNRYTFRFFQLGTDIRWRNDGRARHKLRHHRTQTQSVDRETDLKVKFQLMTEIYLNFLSVVVNEALCLSSNYTRVSLSDPLCLIRYPSYSFTVCTRYPSQIIEALRMPDSLSETQNFGSLHLWQHYPKDPAIFVVVNAQSDDINT